MTEALSEKFLRHVAKTQGISLLKAASFIDQCMKWTAVKLDVEYSSVYNAVFTEQGMEDCLLKEKVCDQLTIEECSESCNCFYLEPFGCISRRIPNADEINEDPDKYIANNLGKLEDLRNLVKIAAYLYYNYDGGGLTDNSYDALEYNLKKRERILGRAFEKIGAPPIDKIRVNLPYPMPSLTKVKPGTMPMFNFLNQFKPSGSLEDQILCCWSVKLDGVSGMLVYKNGKLSKLFTRGDGIIGGDVTYLKQFIQNIPKKIDRFIDQDATYVVRGEFILNKNVWEAKYKDSYANARAFVSAKINAGFVSPALPDVEFLAYEIMVMGDNVPKPSQAFKILVADGFDVADNGIIGAPTTFDIIELYKERRVTSQYQIDGIVLTVDESRKSVDEILTLSDDQLVISVNPQHSVAFKMILEEQIRHSKVINVEWNISRYGRYVPVAIYESVYVDGVRMHRATAHNAAHIRDWSMGKGTKITVVRSGDVIPQIKNVEVDDSITPIFPKTYDDGGYEWSWQGSDIILNDIENNREVKIKRAVHFFETIGVPRLRQKTIEKLCESQSMCTPEDIARASINDFIKVKGIGKKTAEMFYHSIRNTISTTPPDRFIVASTTFKSGVGRKLLKQLFKNIPTILDMTEDEIKQRFAKEKIKGFGPARIKTISEGVPKFRAYLDSFAKGDVELAIKNYLNRTAELDRIGRNPLINGKKFVLTGFMGKTDYELEDYIYDHNGDFVTTVTDDVEAVICGSVLEVSQKMLIASQMHIPVLSLQEFSERYNVPLKRFEEKQASSEEIY